MEMEGGRGGGEGKVDRGGLKNDYITTTNEKQ